MVSLAEAVKMASENGRIIQRVLSKWKTPVQVQFIYSTLLEDSLANIYVCNPDWRDYRRDKVICNGYATSKIDIGL